MEFFCRHQTHSLTLGAGAGAISLQGVIGFTNPLLAFTATNTGAANDITIANNITTNSGGTTLTAGRDVLIGTNGTLTSTGNVAFDRHSGFNTRKWYRHY